MSVKSWEEMIQIIDLKNLRIEYFDVVTDFELGLVGNGWQQQSISMRLGT